MKKIMIITATLALISLSLQAGPKVEMKTSGPSGQGNVIWWAPSTGTTNLEMTTTGLKNVTLAAGEDVAFDDLTINNATIRTNTTVGGTLKVTGTISNTALTASLPVFTDANKVLASGTTGLSVTNATVGGAALSGVGVVVTNATVGGGVLSGVSVVVTNVASATTVAAMTNFAIQSTLAVGTGVTTTANTLLMTNGTISAFDRGTNIATTATTVVTNGTIAVTLNVTSNAFVYLDDGSNIVTNYFVTAVAINTETFTPQTADVLASATLQTVAETLTLTPQTGSALASATLDTANVPLTFNPQTANAIATLTVESGTPVVSAPSITLQTGTPAVSTPTITLQTGTFAKP